MSEAAPKKVYVRGADGFPLKGTFVYPRLNTPDTKFKDEGEYQVRLRVSAEEAAPVIEKVDALATEIFEATKASIEEEIAAATKAKKPLGKLKEKLAKLKYTDKCYKPALDDDGNETGEIEFNFKMTASGVSKKNGKPWTRAPQVFDGKGKELKGKAIPSIWGGTIGRVDGFYNPFCTAVGAGVSLRLEAVQIIKLQSGSGSASAAQRGFAAEEDGYEAEEEPGSQFPGEEGGEGEGSGTDGDERPDF
jgi:hypothetical protein